MKNRFHLEQEILETSGFSKQINLVVDAIENTKSPITKKYVVTLLRGLAGVLDIHSDRLFDTMCQTLGLDEYSDK